MISMVVSNQNVNVEEILLWEQIIRIFFKIEHCLDWVYNSHPFYCY